MPVFALGTALGALLAYFFDPQNGRRRRRTARDRTGRLFRGGARAGYGVKARAEGLSQRVQHVREEPKELDDATIADKVRSEAFRAVDVPSSQVNVNVQEGVVQLRGELERPELIETLVDRTRKVQGVRDVENLLHVRGTDAPMHE